jgi:hypothetical protein
LRSATRAASVSIGRAIRAVGSVMNTGSPASASEQRCCT